MKLITTTTKFLTTFSFALTLLISNNSFAMNGQATQEKPKHMQEADILVTILERTYQPGASNSSMLPAKGILDSRQSTFEDPQAVVQLTDKERDDLVKQFQAIRLHMSRMSPEEAKEHPLRTYKKRIYQTALRLFTTKQAAKQWLRSADCFTDEERELDEFTSQAKQPGYCRSHYLTAKHSITIQKNRQEDGKGLEKVAQGLKKESDTLDTQIAQLQQKLRLLQEEKAKTTAKQERNLKELQSTKQTVESSIKIYDEQLEILKSMLQTHISTIKQLEQEITTLTAQATGLPHKKDAEKTELQQKNEALVQHKKDAAAIKRDIDLLTDSYSLTNKFLWKLSGLLTNYPVEDTTPGKPEEQTQEDKKDQQQAEEKKEKTE